MSTRRAFLVQQGCPHCEGLKAHIEKKGIKVDLIDVDTPEGKAIADRLGVKAIPECVVIEQEGQSYRTCSEKEADEILGEE